MNGLIGLNGAFHPCSPNSHDALARKVGGMALESLLFEGWVVVTDERVYSGENAVVNEKQVRQLLHLGLREITSRFIESHPGGFTKKWAWMHLGNWTGYRPVSIGQYLIQTDVHGVIVCSLTPEMKWKTIYESPIWDAGPHYLYRLVGDIELMGVDQSGSGSNLITKSYYKRAE